MRAGLKRH